MVFTPTDPELGSYYRHVYTGTAGEYTTDLIPAATTSRRILRPSLPVSTTC